MKLNYILIIGILLQLFISCDTLGRKPYSPDPDGPEIVVEERNIPDDATLTADVTFRIIGGQEPYYIYHINGILDTLQGDKNLFKMSNIGPGLRPYVINVRDANYKFDTIQVNFLLPEVSAEGLYKDANGDVQTVEYSFKNFGSQNAPLYVLMENVYSNVYSYGDHSEVKGDLTQPDGFIGQKEYTIYSFEQAFGLEASDYDDIGKDPFYKPVSGTVYVGKNQGICPKYWHIPTNDEYLKIMSKMGISIPSQPNPSVSGAVFAYSYLTNPEEQEIFEKEFNWGYSFSENKFPTWAKPGIGFWTSSQTADYSQYILYTRYNVNKTCLEAWGQNGGRAYYQEHIRCVYDFN